MFSEKNSNLRIIKTGNYLKGYRVIAALLGIILIIATVGTAVITAYAANDTTAVKKSNYVISNMSGAQQALEDIADEYYISALVYLKDVYTIRKEADAYSDSVATVASGQSVYITGVDADSGRNIWYKVQYNSEGGTYTGYVEREFLACADERFLAWEERYVTTVKRESTSSETDCSDIEAFPESYKDALYELKKAHPEWIFVKQSTGLDFNPCVAAEGTGAYSLIYTKSAKSSWIEAKYDNSWSYATDGIIAYYMDPRNFLSETQIFQFEQQTYNKSYHTEESVKKVLNGTFMSGGIEGESVTYAAQFMTLADRYNISPILQAARVRQEQGVQGTSPLISGTYAGFEGYYNYYNVGAVSSNPIIGGLTYAKENGWDSRIKALEGGVTFLCNGYVSKGQDTLYLQKFDVDASFYGVLTHQYMQNIAAPSSEASSAYKAYKNTGLLSGTPFVFRIPVYNNMPSGRSVKPESPDTLSVNIEEVENLPVEQNAVIIPYINGGISEAYEYTYSSSDTSIAAVDENGVITGKRPGSAVITCRAGTAGSVSCKVSVIKADIAIGDVERPDIELTYDPDKTLGDISLPDSFTWVDASTVPVVDNQGYTAIYSPDESRYNSMTMTLEVSVSKATVDAADIDIPEDISASAGAELQTVALPNHFVWEDALQTVAAKAGTYSYMATYCPDEANYNVTEGIEIPVSVICSEHRFSQWSEPAGGYITRTCEICGESESLKVEEKVTDEDCTTLGHNMVDGKCTRCGYTEPTLQEHTHDYTLSSDTSTCTADGVKTYTCSCGDSYTEDAKAAGHHMVTKNGKSVCDICGYEYIPTAAVTPVPTSVPGVTPTPTAVPTKASVPTKAVTPAITATPTPVVPQITTLVRPTQAVTPTPTTAPTTASVPTKAVTPAITATPTPVVPQITTLVKPTQAVTPTPTAAPTTVSVPTKAVTPAITATPTPVVPQITTLVRPTQGVTPTPTAAPTTASMPTKAVTPAITATPTPVVPQITTLVKPTQAVTPTPTTAPTTTAAPTQSAAPTQESAPASVSGSDAGKETVVEAPVNEVTTAASTPAVVMPQITSLVTDKSDIASVEDSSSEEVSSTSAEDTDSKEELNKSTEESEDTDRTDNIEIEAGEGASWQISGDDTVKEQLEGMDMTVTFGEANIPDKIVKRLKTDDYMTMSIAYDGAFGFDALLTVETGEEHAGKYANLYYYNEDRDRLELVDSVKVDMTGRAAFNMKHASDYVISFSDKQMIVNNGSNVAMFAVMAVILAGGLGVLIFVLLKTGLAKNKDDDFYFDLDDDR